MIVEGQSSFLLELDTEQIPNTFEVKLNTDGAVLNALQSKYNTREIRENTSSFTNINVEGDGITHISFLVSMKYLKHQSCNYT